MGATKKYLLTSSYVSLWQALGTHPLSLQALLSTMGGKPDKTVKASSQHAGRGYELSTQGLSRSEGDGVPMLEGTAGITVVPSPCSLFGLQLKVTVLGFARSPRPAHFTALCG